LPGNATSPPTLKERQKKTMEVLVEFEVNVPDGTPDAEVKDRESAEASAAAKLADQGHLVRVWKRPVARSRDLEILTDTADFSAAGEPRRHTRRGQDATIAWSRAVLGLDLIDGPVQERVRPRRLIHRRRS
jgi:muconolactone delta-isomerase